MTRAATRSPGRPRRFDEEAVLDAALGLFWQQGYAETSMTQLQRATGLSSASLANAFGSKEKIFGRVVEYYAERYGSVTAPAADESLPPREALATALYGSAQMQADGTHPSGCLFALSATATSASSAGAAEIVASHRAVTRERIRAAIERGVGSGELPGHTDTGSLTTMFHAFLIGLSTEARDVKDGRLLRTAVDGILNVWDALAALGDCAHQRAQ